MQFIISSKSIFIVYIDLKFIFYHGLNSWYCHFDDDVYVNSPELQKLLSSLEHEDIYYLGIRSVEHNKSVKKNFDTKLIPIVVS